MKIIDKKYGRTALDSAIVFGRLDEALRLIKTCDDINHADNLGYTYLHFAAQVENPEIVAALLERGADVHLKTLTEQTALRVAIMGSTGYPLKHRIAVVESLLKHGAIVNDGFRGPSLKEIAENMKIQEIIDLLDRAIESENANRE